MRFFGQIIISGLMCLLFSSIEINAQTLAFPGAEGFGKYTTGGRGGTVYHVTNLNDDGPGSFRDAVSESNRIVVFDVGGVINIGARIVISKNITIAGQTAPGGGITIYGNGIALTSSSGNTIIRHIRFRMGKNGDSRKDALGISGGKGYILDHVSISWGWDGTVDVNGSGIDDITFQDCIIGQGIDIVGHSTGGLFQSGKWSVIRSLFIDNVTRNPKAKGTHEFINSVVYNWESDGYILGGESEGMSYCNMLGNYFIYGPSTSGSHFTRANSNFHIYGEDNWQDYNKDGVLNGKLITSYLSSTVESTPYDYPGVDSLMSAQDALSYVIENVGASIVRDEVDQLLINEVKSYGTSGAIIHDEDDNGIAGGVGTVANGVAPLDTDRDGMPDEWEMQFGFNPTSIADQNLDNDGDGFTNVEEYINGTDPGEGDGYTPVGIFFIEAMHSSKNMAADTSIDDVNIVQKTFEKGFLQAWAIEGVDTLSKVINKKTGLALSVNNGSVSDGDTIVQTDYLGSDDQLWDFKYQGNGYFSILNKKSNLALTVSEGSDSDNVVMVQRALLDSSFQKFKFISFAKYYNPPKVVLTSPLSGNVFLSSEDIEIKVEATDLDGQIALVEFFDGKTKIGEVDTAPYIINLTGATQGSHELKIKVTDNDGLVTETTPITITVIDAATKSIYIQENDTGFCDVNGSIDIDNDGFTGEGFINTDNSTGKGIDFKVNIPNNGQYFFKVRYANGGSGSRPGKLLVNGEEVIANIDLPATGDWAVWNETSFSTDLEAGETELRIEATTGDGLANVDYLEIMDSLVVPLECASSGGGGGGIGTGSIIQENELGYCNVDDGGAVEDNNDGFTGDGFVNTDNATGEGIDWKVDVARAGTYTVNFRFANGGGSNRPGKLLINGNVATSNVDLEDTGGWTTWDNSSVDVSFPAGKVEVRLEATTGGGLSNIDYIEFMTDEISGTSCEDVIDGVASFEASKLIDVFPNPVKNLLSLQLRDEISQPVQLSIYNMNGILVDEFEVGSKKITKNTSAYEKGIYLIKLQYDGELQTMKFVKE